MSMKHASHKKNISLHSATFVVLLSFVIIALVAPVNFYTAHAQSAADSLVNSLKFLGDWTFGLFFSTIMQLLFWVSGLLLALTGKLLDISISTSLNISNLIKTPIAEGWSILRDVANMTFIFILLYIAIGTILRIGVANTKQALVNVVIIAFLINFSLFFTQVIIDASNILATFFYNNATSITVNLQGANLGEVMTAALKPQTLFDPSKFSNLGQTETGFAFFVGTVGVLLAAFSFLAVAIMFIIRSATLILLMVLSPLAFAAYILDDFREYWKKWWSALLHQSFFAPAYLLVIYIVLLIVLSVNFQNVTKNDSFAAGVNALVATSPRTNTTTQQLQNVLQSGTFSSESEPLLAQVAGPSQASSGAAATGPLGPFSIFFTYFLIIFLINGALVVAKTLGGATATFGTKWAGKGLGAVMGVGAFAARRTIGRGFAALTRNEGFKDFAARSGVGNILYSGAEKAAKGSMDIRGGVLGTALGAGAGVIGADFGRAGGRGGFETIRKEQIKRGVERAKTISQTQKGDPEYVLERSEVEKKGELQVAERAFQDKIQKNPQLKEDIKDLTQKIADAQKEGNDVMVNEYKKQLAQKDGGIGQLQDELQNIQTRLQAETQIRKTAGLDRGRRYFEEIVGAKEGLLEDAATKQEAAETWRKESQKGQSEKAQDALIEAVKALKKDE